MITSNEILEKLKKGESMDDIANSITKVLNIAQQDYAKFQEEEKAKAEEEARRKELEEILMSFCTWGNKYFPKVFKDNINVTTLANTIIEGIDLIGSYDQVFKYLDLDKPLISVNDYASFFGNTTKSKKEKETESLEDLVRKYINL